MESYEVFCPTPQQFQQSSRILHDEYDSGVDMKANESSSSYRYLDRHTKNSKAGDDSTVEILKGFLKEVDVKGHRMFREFAARVEKEAPMERGLRETLHEFRGKTGSEMLEKVARKLNAGKDGEEGFVSREIGEILQEEEKLERFKVKTVNTIGAGVVKEEGQ